jgi:membrane-bound lytic murein transglycosylase D
VTLPEPDPGEQLSTVVLQSGMDVRLAARLAGVDPADMKRFNAAYRRHRMVSGMPYVLRMPADSVDRFQAAAQSIPVALWNDWREQRATRTGGLASWAAELGIPVTVLATANAIGESATIEPATPLLVPGREADPPPELPTTYVVKRGDTLSAIARRHHVTVAELKRLNPRLDARRLHPGDRVRLAATD